MHVNGVDARVERYKLLQLQSRYYYGVNTVVEFNGTQFC